MGDMQCWGIFTIFSADDTAVEAFVGRVQRCVSRKAVREAAVEAHDAFLAHNLADAVHRVLVLAQVRLQSISHSTSNTNNMNKQLEAKNRHNANNMYRPLPEATERMDG